MAFTDTGVGTGTTNFNKTVQELLQRTLQELLRPGLANLPKGAVVPASFQGTHSGGNGVFRFNSVLDLDDDPTAHTLTEGVPPAGQTLDLGYEEFTAGQKGDFVRISDAAEFKNPYRLAVTATERVARQMAGVIDNIAKALWAGGSNAIFAGSSNAATGDVAAGDVMTSALIKKGVALLEGTDVVRLTGNAYGGIIHPFVKFDFELDDDAGGWIDSSRYGASEQLLSGEIGKYAGVKFVSTSNAAIKAGDGTDGIDVYVTTIFGKGAVAFGDLSTKEIIHEHGGLSDPLHQAQTVGWKAWLGGCLVGEGDNSTNMGEPRYINIESAASLG